MPCLSLHMTVHDSCCLDTAAVKPITTAFTSTQLPVSWHQWLDPGQLGAVGAVTPNTLAESGLLVDLMNRDLLRGREAEGLCRFAVGACGAPPNPFTEWLVPPQSARTGRRESRC